MPLGLLAQRGYPGKCGASPAQELSRIRPMTVSCAGARGPQPCLRPGSCCVRASSWRPRSVSSASRPPPIKTGSTPLSPSSWRTTLTASRCCATTSPASGRPATPATIAPGRACSRVIWRRPLRCHALPALRTLHSAGRPGRTGEVKPDPFPRLANVTSGGSFAPDGALVRTARPAAISMPAYI